VIWSWLVVAAAAAILLSLAASATIALLLKVLPEGRARAMVILLPHTLVPDFIPVIGKLDNVFAVIVAIRLSVALIPVPVLIAAWPGEPGQLRLLVGRRLPQTNPAMITTLSSER
jgi:hypothetical protein